MSGRLTEIEISDETAALFQDMVDRGLYPDISTAVTEAIRLLDKHIQRRLGEEEARVTDGSGHQQPMFDWPREDS
jgi:Arc/MetJ-type ribon-helix-helix transcriptional regulator